MAILVTMPSLSPTMESGAVAAWRKQVGDAVEPGEVLAEIETDKAVMDFEIPNSALLQRATPHSVSPRVLAGVCR